MNCLFNFIVPRSVSSTTALFMHSVHTCYCRVSLESTDDAITCTDEQLCIWAFIPIFFEMGACHKTTSCICETLNNMVSIHPLSSLTGKLSKIWMVPRNHVGLFQQTIFLCLTQIGFGLHYNSNVVHYSFKKCICIYLLVSLTKYKSLLMLLLHNESQCLLNSRLHLTYL